MTDQASLPPDAIPIPQAAKLIGLTPERLRQLVRAGYAVSPARGMIRLTTVLSGYCRFLREEASRPDSEGAARGHDAKAELIVAATTRRRDVLIERVEAEAVLGVIRDAATRHLRSLTNSRSAARDLPAGIVGKVADEVEIALASINDAHQAALLALKTGDFSAIYGGGDGR
jgi:hypothetical protein